jgi:hypothetical protein
MVVRLVGWISLVVLCLVGVLPVQAQTVQEPKKEGNQRRALQELLNRKVAKFEEINDPKTTLAKVLDDLSREMDVAIEVNEPAFREQDGGGIPDVLSTPIAEKPLPAMYNTTRERVLRKILSRIPAISGATYIVRHDRIEITTIKFAILEVYTARIRGLPLAHGDFDHTPLEDALQALENNTDFNIVLDPRVGAKARTPVTARIRNVPLDSAVKILADTAGLKPVFVDNVLYVTTKANALVVAEEYPFLSIPEFLKDEFPELENAKSSLVLPKSLLAQAEKTFGDVAAMKRHIFLLEAKISQLQDELAKVQAK